MTMDPMKMMALILDTAKAMTADGKKPSDAEILVKASDIGCGMQELKDAIDELLGKPARVKMKFYDGKDNEQARDVMRILVERKANIYVGKNFLVSPQMRKFISVDGSETFSTAQKMHTSADSLRVVIDDHIAFTKLDKRSNKYVPCNAPSELIDALLNMNDQWTVAMLYAIVSTPFLRRDGTVCVETGYDPESKVYMMEDPDLDVEKIRERLSGMEITEEAGRGAIKNIRDAFSETSFADPASESAAIGHTLAGFGRLLCDMVPGLAVTAPEAGSGKSTLNDMNHIALTGHEHPVIPMAKEEELEKRVATELACGSFSIAIDNITTIVNSAILSMMLTQPFIKVRALGTNKNIEGAFGGLMSLNGNNLVVIEDIVRRLMLCNLDAKMENVKHRRFKRNIREWMKQNRSDFILWCLTVLVVYQRFGRETIKARLADGTKADGLRPLVSYEEWDLNIRGCMVWYGMADPVDNMETLEKQDPTEQLLAQIMKGWESIFGLERSLLTRDLLAQDLQIRVEFTDEEMPWVERMSFYNYDAVNDKLVQQVACKHTEDEKNVMLGIFRAHRMKYNENAKIVESFKAALEEIVGASKVEGRTLGKWLQKMKNRPRNKRMIEIADISAEFGRLWKLTKAEGVEVVKK